MSTRSVKSGAAVLSLLITRNKQGNVFRVQGYNASATDTYLQFHDGLAAPADGTVPLKSILLQATFPFEEQWQPEPFHFENLTSGLIAVVSTTEATLTAAGAGKEADIWIDLEE